MSGLAAIPGSVLYPLHLEQTTLFLLLLGVSLIATWVYGPRRQVGLYLWILLLVLGSQCLWLETKYQERKALVFYKLSSGLAFEFIEGKQSTSFQTKLENREQLSYHQRSLFEHFAIHKNNSVVLGPEHLLIDLHPQQLLVLNNFTSRIATFVIQNGSVLRYSKER